MIKEEQASPVLARLSTGESVHAQDRCTGRPQCQRMGDLGHILGHGPPPRGLQGRHGWRPLSNSVSPALRPETSCQGHDPPRGLVPVSGQSLHSAPARTIMHLPR